jgi:hypothetical protein
MILKQFKAYSPVAVHSILDINAYDFAPSLYADKVQFYGPTCHQQKEGI